MISERLKALRAASGLSQQYIADYLNMRRSTYSAYETGLHEPSLETLCLLADFFRTSTDYLLGRSDYPGVIPRLDDVGGEILRRISAMGQDGRNVVYTVALHESLRYENSSSTLPAPPASPAP